MQPIDEKYQLMAPKLELLTDTVVLSQAWKKTHTHIRSHNSYADNLHLDSSAVDLEKKLNRWASAIDSGNYKPIPLRMVPSPKSGLWNFLNDNWVPSDLSTSSVMRPLAHVSMRDQVTSTALMLCLAECIESAQGDPESNSIDVTYKTNSYGNRLHCQYNENGIAKFPWGNSETYSKYSEDYKNFIARPTAIAENLEDHHDNYTYIVKLDISSFYDHIDIDFLISTIQEEYENFRTTHNRPAADKNFWKISKKILDFRWTKQTETYLSLLKNKKLPQGLPQGLTAAGFFANAYLLKFDRAIAAKVGSTHKNLEEIDIEIIDYCRYVDDLRFVVSTSEAISEPSLGVFIQDWAQQILSENTSLKIQLSFNPSKTEAELFSFSGRNTGIASTMKALQTQLSGPFDFNSLVQTEAGLNGLLATAELGFHIHTNKSLQNSRSPLAAIARPKTEVKDDTLTRFAAYRLSKVLQRKLLLSDLSSKEDTIETDQALEYEFEALARRLIGVWLFNPSLVQVLKYALNTFPSPELAKPILDELIKGTQPQNPPYIRYHAFYIITEIFRAAATETGFWMKDDSDFSVGDLPGYRSYLATRARSLISDAETPWYTIQQASFFLSTRRIRHELPKSVIFKRHALLQSYLFPSYQISFPAPPSEFAGISVIGNQIIDDIDHHLDWFQNYTKSLSADDFLLALETTCDLNYPLAENIITSNKNKITPLHHSVPEYLELYSESRWTSSNEELPKKEWIPLSDAMLHPSAPFKSENSLLFLAYSICRSDFFNSLTDFSRLSPLSIEIKTKDWDSIENLSPKALEIQLKPGAAPLDPHDVTPPWIKKSHEWRYALGRVLRSVAIGEPDFTAQSWALRTDHQKYSGLRTTWDKRRIGMSHSPYNLGGTTHAFTPWFSELITALLTWPGATSFSKEIHDLTLDINKEKLSSIIHKRILHQRRIFGKSSCLPTYEYPIDWRIRDSRNLRILMIQGLLPAVGDFSIEEGLATMEKRTYRASHRNHLASILKIAYSKIIARRSLFKKDNGPDIDLVLIPEYGVHPKDQDLLRAFSDATGSILFFGLLGARHPESADSFVNAARWLIPTKTGNRRSWICIDQGKKNLTGEEKRLPKLIPWRPHQVLIRLNFSKDDFYRISGAICYDATDLSLAADLRDLTHAFVVLAMNNDIKTFDNMVSALRYHMYQHIIIANSGEFGGSTAQAPYDVEHKRLISHTHGSGHITATIFDIPIDDFGPRSLMGTPNEITKKIKTKVGKTPPAGIDQKKRSK